jgi:hypothetical protein
MPGTIRVFTANPTACTMQSMRHNVGRWMREAQLHKCATESMQYCAHRGMAVRNSRGRVKDDASAATAATAEAPELRATMRKLAFLVHPDRFAGMPDAAKENEASLAFLQVVMNSTHTSRGRQKSLCISSVLPLPRLFLMHAGTLVNSAEGQGESSPGRSSVFFFCYLNFKVL